MVNVSIHIYMKKYELKKFDEIIILGIHWPASARAANILTAGWQK